MSERIVSLPVYMTVDDREALKKAANRLGKATAAELVRDAVNAYMESLKEAPVITGEIKRGGNRRKLA